MKVQFYTNIDIFEFRYAIKNSKVSFDSERSKTTGLCTSTYFLQHIFSEESRKSPRIFF